MFRKIFISILLLVFLSACLLEYAGSPTQNVQSVDQAIRQTREAQTRVAFFIAQTLAAQAIPTDTPNSGVCTDRVTMLGETVPDGEVFPSGTEFMKMWMLKNTGTCTWTSDYAFVFLSGEKMDAASEVDLPAVVQPGESVEVAVDMVAPLSSGVYRGDWIIRNASGNTFGWGDQADQVFWVSIEVDADAVAVPMPVTQTPPPPKAAESGTRDGGHIDFGHPVTGTINDEFYAEFWYFSGEQSQVISIMMTSPATAGNLDGYLELWYFDASEWKLVAADDNSGGGENGMDAMILAYQLPYDGDYAITAKRWGAQGGTTSGQYAILLTSYVSEETNGRASWSFAPCDIRFEPGSEKTYSFTGEVSQNNPSRVHTFDGNEGDILRIIMTRTSGDLNPLVELRFELTLSPSSSPLRSIDVVLAYGGAAEPAQNATGIYHYDLPYTGKYKVVATRYGWEGGSSSGQYTLSVDTGTPVYDNCNEWTWNKGPKPGNHQGGITIALIDSGIDLNKLDPGVYDVLLDGYSYQSGGIIRRNELTDTCRSNGQPCLHGTYWANLIHGIAADVKILPIIDNGSDTWAAAIRYAVDGGTNIINMSFANAIECSHDLQEAVDKANAADILVVASVGNSPGSPTLMAPARCRGVLGVGVSPSITNSNETVDLVVAQNSSSAATATISAYAARIWEKYPDYYNYWVWCALKASTGNIGRSDEYGWGLANLDAALTKGAVGCSLGGPP